MKTPVSFRLSEDAIRILDEMARRWGLSRTGVVEMVLRKEAERADPVPSPAPRPKRGQR
jgi:predicted transcriptional regulator